MNNSEEAREREEKMRRLQSVAKIMYEETGYHLILDTYKPVSELCRVKGENVPYAMAQAIYKDDISYGMSCAVDVLLYNPLPDYTDPDMETSFEALPLNAIGVRANRVRNITAKERLPETGAVREEDGRER